jgi:UDP-4-amino-4,6-dideoxy-N-acetyl-beta-L-altrosamine N-acetyltransferase
VIAFGYGALLGPLSPDRLEKYRNWRNQPAIRNWCGQWDLITPAGQRRWFERVDSDPTTRMYEILTLDERPAGVCGLSSIDLIARRAEFSIYVAPEFQGKGLGEAALRTLVEHGFKSLGLHSIWGETFSGNPAAKLFEKVGFQKEGTRRACYFKRGEFINADLYSILGSEWAGI